MVKRKAVTSIDEWLEEGVLYAEANQVRIAPVSVEEAPEPTPIVRRVLVGEEATLLPTVLADIIDLDNTEWFWNLLEQAGYERW